MIMAAMIIIIPFTLAASTHKYFDQYISVVEAESFAVASTWSSQDWIKSPHVRFSSTIANTFHSRRGFLSASAEATDGHASATFEVGTAGVHQIWVRYEAAYRHETPFRLTVSQGGKTIVSHVYGWRKTPKLNAFINGRKGGFCAPGMVGECRWPYGATENMVWETASANATLAAGPASLTLEVVPHTPSGSPSDAHYIPTATRNVDTILVTPNASDVALRLQHEGTVLALDGLLSQGGEVYARVTNTGKTPLLLRTLHSYDHSPYFAMHLNLPVAGATPSDPPHSGCSFRSGGPYCATFNLSVGETSTWVEVGQQMDAFNHGTWNWPAGNYTLTFGVRDASKVIRRSIVTSDLHLVGTFNGTDAGNGTNGMLQVLYDPRQGGASPVPRVRPRNSDFYELLHKIEANAKTLHGKPPSETLVFAIPFTRNHPDSSGSSGRYTRAYDDAQRRFQALMGVVDPGPGDWSSDAWVPPAEPRRGDGSSLQIAQLKKNLTHLAEHLNGAPKERREAVKVVNLGDEIPLPAPIAGNVTNAQFKEWAVGLGLSAADVGCPSGTWTGCFWRPDLNASSTHPALYYHSHRFSHAYGYKTWKAITDVVTAALPNAAVGANFPPGVYYQDTRFQPAVTKYQPYTGNTAQWINTYRHGAMTMGWTEDWAFQVPLGTQQMFMLSLDVFRAGLRTKKTSNPPDASIPAPPIQVYTIQEFPGNNPTSWTRLFWGDLAHGLKILNLFFLQTAQSGYTCDYTDPEGGTYETIQTELYKLGTFEDIVQAGVAQARGAKAAILYSETADIFRDNEGTFGAGKRSLYVALKHAELPVDIVTEEDVIDGELSRLGYHTLYLTEPHITRAAATALGGWVEKGGHVWATAGAGLRDESNQTNTAAEALFGIKESGVFVGAGTDPDDVARDPEAKRPRAVQFIKQDLPFAPTLDTVTLKTIRAEGRAKQEATTFLAIGAKSIFTVSKGGGGGGGNSDVSTNVLGTFSDGSPAVVRRSVGKGTATYSGFLPQLSYFHPAIPKRPVDRASSASAFTHFVPTAFDVAARAFIAAPLEGVAGAVPIRCSEPLVEAGIIEADALGMVVPLINWAGAPLKGLVVNLQFAPHVRFTNVSLASGKPLTSAPGAANAPPQSFTLDLDVADAIILRKV